MSRLLFLTALLPRLVACKRLDHDTVVEGTVIDRHTTARIAHATVVVFRPGSGGQGGGYVEQARYQADASGNFSFRLDDDRDDLLLRAYSDLGAYTIWQESIHLQGGHNNKDLQLKVQSPAWLKIHVLDELPADIASISLHGFAPTSVGFSNVHDTTLVCYVPGNDTVRCGWMITPLGKAQIIGYQYLYFPALDTIPLELRY